MSDGARVRDLYWEGELTDSLGHRWQIDIVPGVATSARRGRDGFAAAGKELSRYGSGGFWSDRVQNFRDGIEFAFDDVLTDFVVRGIREDYSYTTGRIRALASETPFGWQPRLVARILFGYLLQPAGRIGFGAGGVAGGTAYAVVAPPLATLEPALAASWDGSVDGLASPALRVLWHHPAFLLALMNREPAESLDGRFGLRILRPEGDAPVPQLIPRLGFEPLVARELPRGFTADPPTWHGDRHATHYRGDGDRSFTLVQRAITPEHRAVACGERAIGPHCAAVTTTPSGYDVYESERGYWLRVRGALLQIEDPDGVFRSRPVLLRFVESLRAADPRGAPPRAPDQKT